MIIFNQFYEDLHKLDLVTKLVVTFVQLTLSDNLHGYRVKF